MTLPEHAICSFLLACCVPPRQRAADLDEAGDNRGLPQGTAWTVLVTIAGISPDFDVVAKLFGDQYFWQLHHALGHSFLSISVLAFCVATIGYLFLKVKPYLWLFAWCWLAAFVHCLTDTLYWWGVKPLWPFHDIEITMNVLEYIDLFVLGIWLTGAWKVYRSPDRARRIAVCTLALFCAYVGLRVILPKPTGLFSMLTGNWMYAFEQGTPVLDWW